MKTRKFLVKAGAVAAVSASALLMGGGVTHAQQVYPPVPRPPVVAPPAVRPPVVAPPVVRPPVVLPPAPPVVVPPPFVAQAPPPGTIPKTGSNGVGSTSTIAATIAAAGVGMVFAARRRRETTAN